MRQQGREAELLLLLLLFAAVLLLLFLSNCVYLGHNWSSSLVREDELAWLLGRGEGTGGVEGLVGGSESFFRTADLLEQEHELLGPVDIILANPVLLERLQLPPRLLLRLLYLLCTQLGRLFSHLVRLLLAQLRLLSLLALLRRSVRTLQAWCLRTVEYFLARLWVVLVHLLWLHLLLLVLQSLKSLQIPVFRLVYALLVKLFQYFNLLKSPISRIVCRATIWIIASIK